MGKGGAFGCGRCLPCRIKKRREWTHRIMQEASLHAHNSFVTLTYEISPITVVAEHHRQFMDALRKKLAPKKIRFYMVGEYGGKYGRPHYHYALFGYPSCRRALSPPSKKWVCCEPCDTIRNVWGKGRIENAELTPFRCRYIARYVIKKMTRTDDPRLGPHQWPEFSRQSLKPGIGRGIVPYLAVTIRKYNLLTPEGDVPVAVFMDGKNHPLGRYLRKQLRKELGLNEKSPETLSPEAAHAAYLDNHEMRAVQEAARNDPENPSLKHHLLKSTEARRAQIHARNKVFTTKDKL